LVIFDRLKNWCEILETVLRRYNTIERPIKPTIKTSVDRCAYSFFEQLTRANLKLDAQLRRRSTHRAVSTTTTTILTLTLTGKSSVLAVNYFPAIDLSDGDYKLGLMLFETYHTMSNVNASNNKFYFGKDDAKITIPEGNRITRTNYRP